MGTGYSYSSADVWLYVLKRHRAEVLTDFGPRRTHHATFPACWSAPGTVCRSPSVGTDRRTVSPTDWIIRTGNSIVVARSRLWEAPSCSAAVLRNLTLSEAIVHVDVSINTAATSPVVCPSAATTVRPRRFSSEICIVDLLYDQ